MYRLSILSTWRNPLIIPLLPESLLLTWNPSFLYGAILVHPCPRLLVNWPPPPHTLFPPTTVPQFNYAPIYGDITTPTSLSSAHVLSSLPVFTINCFVLLTFFTIPMFSCRPFVPFDILSIKVFYRGRFLLWRLAVESIKVNLIWWDGPF